MSRSLMRRSFIVLVAVFVVFVVSSSTPPPRQGGTQASIERGKLVYETHCLACHQENGSGVPGLNPPLVKTKWVLGDKKKLIDVVLKGMDEQIEINGETYNNVMPAQPTLTDQEIADVLTYVRNSFGNKAPAVLPKEVKAQR